MLRIKPWFLAAAILPATASAERWPDLEDCVLTTPGTPLSAQARCGTLSVPENPADPDGRHIDLNYAVAPARSANPQPDPVVFLAGGPGQAATETWPFMQFALRGINRERDVLLLDQRGTGGSNALDCDFSGIDPYAPSDLDALEEFIRECKRGWDADVRFYTTADGADDLELLRARLAIEQLNLIGGSYGTRMAQVYLRRHPDRVRSIILDGVVPTRLALGSEHAEKLDAQLKRLFAVCAADDVCNERYPDLEAAFDDLKYRYRDHEDTIQVTHPRTGQSTPLRFNHDVLAGALRLLAYSPSTQMQLPLLVHEVATTGHIDRLASQYLMVTADMADVIAFGLNLTVGCSEDWPRWPRNIDQSDTLLGNQMNDFYARLCAWWPAGERDSDFHTPFDSEVPILILSGELDPVTPPEYGEEASAQFSNSLHLVAAGQGHIVLRHGCFDGIAEQFIAAASVEDLDTACMDRLGPEPFFLNLLGPAP